MSIYSIVAPIMQAAGVPDRLWLSIASVESSFNPDATGDNGTSFGLFQLHVGGQAPPGVPTSQLFDPATNAKYAAPAIANAWKQLGSSFDDSISWWLSYAALSGHPGGNSSNSATIEEATRLKLAYDTNSFQNDTSTGGIMTTTDSSVTSSPASLLAGLPAFMDNVGLDLLLFSAATIFVVIGIHFMRG